MAAADEFGPNTLIQKCFKFLQEEMCSDNVCITLEEAHKRNEEQVFNRCMQFILVNAIDVLSVRGFAELCRECVMNIVKSDRLNADEFSVYDGLVFWGQEKCVRMGQQATEQNIREALGDLLFEVRFPIMDVQQFTERLSTKNILTSKEKIELYQFVHGDKHSLSSCFNTNLRKEYKVRDDFKLPEIEQNQASSSGQPPANTKRGRKTPERSTHTFKTQDFHQTSPNNFRQNSDVNLHLHRVTRYNGISGPWLLKGVDAIAFTCSRPIILRGVVLYGPYTGSSIYQVELSVFDELKNQIRYEESTLQTSDPGDKFYDVTLRSHVRVPPRKLFTVAVRLKNGMPTYQGISGMSCVKGKGVDFEFHNSSMSHNGTDVLMGQIPGLLYNVP